MFYKDRTRRRASSLAALSIIVAALCGCGTEEALFQSDNVTSRDQAAGVLVSVTSVAPWSQVSDAMAPNFTLANGDAALSQIAPVTQRLQSQILNAFGVSLGLGLPQTSTQGSVAESSSNSSTLNNANGVVTTAGATTSGTTSTRTTTISPGTAPQVQTAIPASATLPAAAGIAGDIGIDPILKYQAALALYQEVQLLNRQIQNAAIYSCDVPYLVQLKLAVMPYRRHLPYDMHARISFFPSTSSEVTPVTPAITQETAATDAGSGEDAAQPADNVSCNGSTDNPRILPLLVTDDIQQAMTSRAVDTARQIGLALAAMIHGVGANGSFNDDSQSLQAVSGADLNSTLTVARQTENTMYVRIGAAYEGTSGYALVGQTHDISAILLVPKRYIDSQPKGSAPSLHVIAYSQFRNATNGKPLGDRSADALLVQEDAAIKGYLAHAYDPNALDAWNGLNESQKAYVADNLLADVQWNDFDDFKNRACDFGEVPGNVPYRIFPTFDCAKKGVRDTVAQLSESLWTTLSVLRTDGAYQSEHLQLPIAKPLNFDGIAATVTALNDKENLLVNLEGIDGALPFKGSARVDFIKAGKTYSLLSTSLTFDATSHVLTITFPSPDKWGIPTDGSAKLHFTPYCVHKADCPKIDDVNLALLTEKDSSKDATPNFALAPQAKRVIALHGVGSVAVAVAKMKDDSATLTVDGADLKSATDESGKALAVSGGQVTVTQNGVVTLQLTNLHVGDTISVTAEGKKSGKSTGKALVQWTVFGS